jgi:hypothetical protein
MAINSLYPGFVKIFYNSNGHEHVQTVPVQPYIGVGGGWWLTRKDGTPGAVWTTQIATYAALLRPYIHTTGAINRAELWTMASPTADPIYQDSVTLTLAGTNATVATPYLQRSVTYRSQTGGLYRFILMETSEGRDLEAYPPFSGIDLATANYLVSGPSVVCARDGGFLVVPIRLLTKTNDQLRKKYLLDA